MLSNQMQRKAQSALQKKLNQMMNKESQDELEWFVDEESECEYKWKYSNPLDGSVTRMVYSFQNKTVTVDTRYPLRK